MCSTKYMYMILIYSHRLNLYCITLLYPYCCFLYYLYNLFI